MDALSAATGAVTSFFSGPKPPQNLNPICALFWLAMLDWQQDGVKIGIVNHKVKYYPPGDDQAKKRRAAGVGRGDLGYFLEALEKVKRYWGREKKTEVLNVANRAHQMLIRLERPYKDDRTILSCVGNYRRILEDILQGVGGEALTRAEQVEKRHCELTLQEAWGLFDKRSIRTLETLIDDNQDNYLRFLQEQQAPPPRMTSSYPPRSFPAPIPQAAPAATSSLDSSSPHSSVSSTDALSDIANQLHPGTSPQRADRMWPQHDADGNVVGYHNRPPGDDAEF